MDEGVLHVVNLLKSPSGSVQRNAAWVLAMLAVDSNMADEITKYGFVMICFMNTVSLSGTPGKGGFCYV